MANKHLSSVLGNSLINLTVFNKQITNSIYLPLPPLPSPVVVVVVIIIIIIWGICSSSHVVGRPAWKSASSWRHVDKSLALWLLTKGLQSLNLVYMLPSFLAPLSAHFLLRRAQRAAAVRASGGKLLVGHCGHKWVWATKLDR